MSSVEERPRSKNPRKLRQQKERSSRARDIQQHLEENYFNAHGSPKYAARRQALARSLAEHAAKQGTSTKLLAYHSAETAPRVPLSGEHLSLVHLTRFVPKNGVIQPLSRTRKRILRESIHSAVNSAVGSHTQGNWSGATVAVIIPVSSVTHWLTNFYTVDSWGFGQLKLPAGSVVLIDKHHALKERLSDGQALGRATVRVIDLAKYNRELKQVGILPESKLNKLFARLARKMALAPLDPKRYELLDQIKQTQEARGATISYSLESPMHYAVVKELLHQGRLPMVSATWSWSGWWANGGLRSFAKQYGFSQTPHQGSLGTRLTEESLGLRTTKNRDVLAQGVRAMRKQIQLAVRQGEFSQPRMAQTARLLKKRVRSWSKEVKTRNHLRRLR